MIARFFCLFFLFYFISPLLDVYWICTISNNGMPDGKAGGQRENSIPQPPTQTTFAGVG